MVIEQRWSVVFLTVLAVFLAGCGGSQNGQPLPTLMELPTTAATATDDLQEIIEPAVTATPSPDVTETSPVTETPTVTPSNTITPTPTRTPTITPTFTPEPTETPYISALSMLAELAAQATVLPPDFLGNLEGTSPGAVPHVPGLGTPGFSLEATPPPSAQCTYLPPGGFGQLVLDDPSLIMLIGCPVGAPPTTAARNSAWQRFERGGMIWLEGSPGTIIVLYNNGTFQQESDTFTEGVDPEHSNQNPPAGMYEPVRGFGKVWRSVPGVRDGLGWAISQESGVTATLQEFAQGRMLYLPGRDDIIVLFHQGSITSGGWRSVPGQF